MKKTPLKPPITDLELTGVLERGTELEGKLCFCGTFQINGCFKGEVFSPDTLIIGDGGRVNGNVDVGVAIITGEFTGSLKARRRVEIHKPAIFKGEILTPSLSVEDGVLFEGSSKMT